jgi:hypothetical protein
MGLALVALGVVIAIKGHQFKIKDYATPINIGASLFFGIVLLWWAFSENKPWGIGFETITMAVTVVLAVLGVLTLTGL